MAVVCFSVTAVLVSEVFVSDPSFCVVVGLVVGKKPFDCVATIPRVVVKFSLPTVT